MEVLSDRRPPRGVVTLMKAGNGIAIALSLGLGTLGACSGGLENPDLTTGAVSGRVANAAPAGGYVYLLGAPALLAPIAADGSFGLGEVPVGAQELVVVAGYQGGGVSVTKAALAPVTVRPGMRERLSQDAAQMPAAGRVVAAVRPPAGAVATGAAFSALRSNQIDKTGTAGGQVLGDLPAGAWQVTARLPGFRAAQPVSAVVPAGSSVQVEIALEVEAGDDLRGCLSTGCDNGLRCSPADGMCYPCLTGADCNAGDTCDPVSHTCSEGTDGGGELCELADTDAKCPGGVRVPLAGGLGYCSRACPGGDADCPANKICHLGAAGDPNNNKCVSCSCAGAATFDNASWCVDTGHCGPADGAGESR